MISHTVINPLLEVKWTCILILFSCLKQLFLMKRGGQVIYAGSLGHQSHRLVEYFEVRKC